jgi:hypothetical protein
MDENDKIISEHLEKNMESPEFRKLLAGMLIADGGDLTTFIKHYRLGVLEQLAGVE